MIHFFLDKLVSLPPFRLARIGFTSLYDGFCALSQPGLSDVSQIPALIVRLQLSEKKILELTERVERLEHELSSGSSTLQSNATGVNCSANATKSTSQPDHNGDDIPDSEQQPEQPITNGVDHVTNGESNLPQPPAPSLTVDKFNFTSTPNPVFLSRGKLHHKAHTKSMDISRAIAEEEDQEDFAKNKKQRVLQEDLISQKKILRKIAKIGQSPIQARRSSDPLANRPIEEEEDGSLDMLLKNALKRKFANVDISSLNESHFTEDNSEFSL